MYSKSITYNNVDNSEMDEFMRNMLSLKPISDLLFMITPF